MTNFWKQPGVPHKGWSLIDVIDIRDYGQGEEDTEYETCMMCGHEKIRYVHIVEHQEIDEEFRVGCVCAKNMTNDYVNPGKKERNLRNRANRRNNWSKRNWKISQKGNLYLKIDTHLIVIFEERKSKKYKVMIDKVVGNMTFESIELAKLGAFLGVEYFKELGEW